jgi:diacylglycerol kinase
MIGKLKDIAAGAVLIAGVDSVCVGIILFEGRLS